MPSIRNSENERGQTLLLACVSMIVLLSMAALAVDVSIFYVARTEAQRAADAAALAGATVFSTSGCTSSPGTANSCSSATVQQQVRQQAEAVGAQNKVFGQLASIADADVTFPASAATNPLVQVQVHRTMNAFFGNPLRALLGGGSWGPLTVAARATAEAFNPSGSNTPFATSCLKPWIVANCDPNHASPTNQLCGGGKIVNNNSLANPGPYPTGVIGSVWQLHVNTGPSQYEDVSYGVDDESKADYRTNISTCAIAPIHCGDTVHFINGAGVGPTRQGVDNLINGPNGQDVMWAGAQPVDPSLPGITPPLTIKAGTGNPLVTSGLVRAGDPINVNQSSSVVTVPVFDGHSVNPGNGQTGTIIGFLQMFVIGYNGNGNNTHVDSVILNVASCGNSGNGGGGPPVTGGGSTLVPIRLVRNPGT